MKNRPLIILSLLVITLVLIWLLEPVIFQALFVSNKITDKLQAKQVVNIAHRGASGHAPENTIAAIELAIEMGADMIAIDVHVTKDGEVVVLHDETMERTTNGKGNVHELTLAEIKQLDAGSWFDAKYAGEKVPTLDEVLKHINGRVECLIELKSKGKVYYEGFAELVADIIENNEAVDWTILESYNEKYLDEVYEYDPRIQIKQILIGEDNTNLLTYFVRTRNIMNTREKHKYLAAVNPPYHALSKRRVFSLHARRLKVYTFLVNDKNDMVKAINMGVDGIITDFPDKLHDIKIEIEKL